MQDSTSLLLLGLECLCVYFWQNALKVCLGKRHNITLTPSFKHETMHPFVGISLYWLSKISFKNLMNQHSVKRADVVISQVFTAINSHVVFSEENLLKTENSFVFKLVFTPTFNVTQSLPLLTSPNTK